MPSIEPQPRSSLPLPPELTKHVLFFLAQPLPDSLQYWRDLRQKFAQPRSLRRNTTYITNARLVCKTFAELAAPFLVKGVWVAADHKQLAQAALISRHPQISKGLQVLVYDASLYSDCRHWTIDTNDFETNHVANCDECDGSRADSEAARDGQWRGHLEGRAQLYKEQERILNDALDAQCVASALELLPNVKKVVFKCQWNEWRISAHAAASPGRVINAPDAGELYLAADLRPFRNLLHGVSSVPNNIRTLDLDFHLLLLADLAEDTERFDGFCGAVAQVTDLKFTLGTTAAMPQSDPEPGTADERYAEETLKAVVRSGVLGRVVGSAKNLHRLKLNLARDGRRRGSSGPWRFDAPLSAYVGEGTTSWPDLRYLFLGSVDVRQDEMVQFLVRHRKIEVLDLDRLMLTQGQWRVVDEVAQVLLPWTKLKMCRLDQVEAERHGSADWPSLLREVDGAIAKKIDEYGSFEEQQYFKAGDEQSTLSCQE